MGATKDGGSKRREKQLGTEKTVPIKKAKTQEQVSLRISDTEKSIGPVLASFGDFTPDRGVAFSLYHAPSDSANNLDKDDSGANMDERLLLVGETPIMQYTSSNWSWGASSSAPADVRRETRGYSGEYLLGIYDKNTQQVTLRKAPVFTLNRSVRALENLNAMAVESGAQGFDYTKARRDLGEAFGNKKQKQAARNMDRMKVNTENMDGVLEHVASGIDASAAEFPSENSLAQSISASRALPQARMEAQSPADAYPLFSLVPAKVFNALGIHSMFSCATEKDLSSTVRVLPHPSHWLLPRLWHAVSRAYNDGGETAASAKQVRIGYYLAILLAFRKNVRGLSRIRDDYASILGQKMRLPDGEKDIVMEELLSKFTEMPRGSQKCVYTRGTNTPGPR
ncbi:DNA-directed RNA polymerase I subunit rpa49 [Malassezia vespertilionis]|uniref:DNA-directed RNA polymerase I subunit rpa49 n=1 Tax=Malassezia vespertilionis TaxID=2020962 RepID=UPI0024B09679|nr:DNA-directed RNA polymerase I subunit rpa49 [Malassezia vespertilionis]WFD06426.1 DNA-directed RNA polymerase I subunit rpa49 [Malassezia vespertilionis]